MIFVFKSISNLVYGIFIVSCYHISPLLFNFLKSVIPILELVNLITCLSFMLLKLSFIFFISKHSATCFGLNNTFLSNSNISTSLFSKVHDTNIQNYNLTIV